jgi:hypothetical protein
LINMVIPQATVEGFEGRPAPADWTDLPPGSGAASTSQPIVNRYQRAYSPSAAGAAANAAAERAGATSTAEAPEGGAPAAPAFVLPPRTIGSKIPINKRHKRRR